MSKFKEALEVSLTFPSFGSSIYMDVINFTLWNAQIKFYIIPHKTQLQHKIISKFHDFSMTFSKIFYFLWPKTKFHDISMNWKKYLFSITFPWPCSIWQSKCLLCGISILLCLPWEEALGVMEETPSYSRTTSRITPQSSSKAVATHTTWCFLMNTDHLSTFCSSGQEKTQ